MQAGKALNPIPSEKTFSRRPSCLAAPTAPMGVTMTDSASARMDAEGYWLLVQRILAPFAPDDRVPCRSRVFYSALNTKVVPTLLGTYASGRD